MDTKLSLNFIAGELMIMFTGIGMMCCTSIPDFPGVPMGMRLFLGIGGFVLMIRGSIKLL